MSTGLRVAAAAVIAAAVGRASAGAASADNSNNNTNTNDLTNVDGDYSTGATSSGENTNWPPTDLSWPPKDIMNSGADETGGSKGHDSSAATPIVMPLGQPIPADTAAPSTSETPKPIVPVNTP